MTEIEQLNQYAYHKDHLDVGNGHQIYFERFGNPEGIPVLFIHGGPGLGCTIFDKRFFHPAKFNVLFFDQRGAGKSTPSRSIEHNTSQDLVEDIEKLLEHTGMDKVHIFAGSWGSTLAMLYAIKNPEKVLSMILRGYFPGTRDAKSFFEQGGTAYFHPEAWQRLNQLVPSDDRTNVSSYYLSQLLSDDESKAAKFAYELVYYNVATAKIGITDQELNMIINNGDILGKAIIQCHYSANDFFLEDNYILRNTEVLKDIPITLIHGRYDMICPLSFAYELDQHLPNSRLIIVTGGHLSSEPEIEKELNQALNNLSI